MLYLSVFIIGVAVTQINIPAKQKDEYYGIVLEARDSYIIYESNFVKYYVECKDNDFEMGDYLVIKGEISKYQTTTYESRFNFETYLSNKGVNNEIKTKSIDRKIKALFKTHAFKKRFLSRFDENTAALVSAFLFNDKDYSTYPIKLADSNGVLFLFSMSGMYLQALFGALNYLLYLRFSKRTSRLLAFALLFPYAIFSFTKIGTLRVYALYILKYLNDFRFKRKRNHIELVSILALFFLIIDYHLAYQEAFYIGFLLSILSPFMHNASKVLPRKRRKLVYLLLVRLFVLPISIRNGELAILFLISQSIIFPINFLFVIVAILSTAFPLKKLLSKVGKLTIWVLEKMDLINIKLPLGTWGGALGIFIVVVFFLILYFLEAARYKHLKLSILSLATFFLISLAPIQEPVTNAVFFLNVGQGDSIIIKNRNHTVMIDTGGNKSFDMAMECLIPFMNKNKITHLDALITTHDDFDHAGAKNSLMSNFRVKNYLTKNEQFPYKIGDIELINLNTKIYEEDNDNSLVLYMNFMHKEWLFMGDASTKVEKDIISENPDLNCDIIKLGHHGSKTSSSLEFLEAVEPDTAIVSVAAKNYYGHPNDEVIDRLRTLNIKIRRTDEEGTISYYSLLS